MASAQKLNSCIDSCLDGSQAYRVDHYLTKTLIGYAYPIIRYLKKEFAIVQASVIFDETIGIEGRGNFYEKVGVVSDVIQNHALQIMASFLAGESPAEKANFLRSLYPIDCMLGQYEGYQQEANVSPNSSIPTYAYATLKSRLVNFPIFIRAGKKLAQKATEFEIVLAEKGHCCKKPVTLTFRLAPHEEIVLSLPLKTPNTLMEQCRINLRFPITSVEAYTVLLARIIGGDVMGSVSRDEIEAQWRLAERLEALPSSLFSYPHGFKAPIKAMLGSFQISGRDAFHDRFGHPCRVL